MPGTQIHPGPSSEYHSVGQAVQARSRQAICYIAPTLDTNTPDARGRGQTQATVAQPSPSRRVLTGVGAAKHRLAGFLLPPRTSDAGTVARPPWLAALLSFLWPGAGQLYTRQRRLAAIFSAPVILVLLLLAYELRRGPVVLAARLLAERDVAVMAIALVVAVGAWQLLSVAQAYASGNRAELGRRRDRAVFAVLAVVILVSHLVAGYFLLSYSDAGDKIFVPSNPLVDQPVFQPSLAPGETAGPTDAPLPTPANLGRVTILFTALSSGGEQLFDSIMVVSYDPKTNSVQMVSVPRDSASFPFYFGGTDTVSHKLNELPKAVNNKWIISPDKDGYTALVKEVSFLVGIPINYYAWMDLQGFVKMIDQVGGIDIVNATVINDGKYDWLDGSPYGFYLAAGQQHLDGRHALAYVRSRESTNDFDRAGRQQQALIALLHKMAQADQILALPGLISTVGSSIHTNFPPDQLADYIDRLTNGQDPPTQHIANVVLGVPAYGNYIAGTSASCLYIAKVATESITLFGADSTWSGKPAPANTCPAGV